MKIKITGQMIFSVALLLALLLFVITASGYSPKARFVPLVIGIPTLALAIYQVQTDWRRGVVSEAPKSGEGPSTVRKEWYSAAWVIGCFALIWLIGFEWGLPLYAFLYAKVRSKEGWLVSIAPGVVAYLVLWIFFITLLHIPLYKGVLFELLSG